MRSTERQIAGLCSGAEELANTSDFGIMPGPELAQALAQAGIEINRTPFP
jgi:hypothetical protein